MTREPWKIERLEGLREQHAASPSSLAAKQAYINGLEHELAIALRALPAQVVALPGYRLLNATEQRASAEAEVFDAVCELWPNLPEDIHCDPYDDSLEVTFGDEVPPDFAIDDEQGARILALGFARFWLNFKDGSEQYGYLQEGKPCIGQRHIVPGKAERYAAAPPAAQAWVSVKERLPEMGEMVLVWITSESVGTDCREECEDGRTVWFANYGEEVTHWMPLPLAPGREG